MMQQMKCSETQFEKTMEIAADCVHALRMPEDLDKALAYVADQLGTFIQAERLCLYRFEDHEWRAHLEWNRPSQMNFGDLPSVCDVLSSWEDGEPLFLEFPDMRVQIVVTPLYPGVAARGCLVIYRFESPLPPGTKQLLKMITSAVAAAFWLAEREGELRYLCEYDAFTGVFNRAVYIRQLEMERSEIKSVGIVRLQITDVKKLSMLCGYAQGDELLRRCARRISDLFQSEGKLYRIDRDELAIICFGLERDTFEELAIQLGPTLEHALHCTAVVGYQWSARDKKLSQLDLAAAAMLEEEQRHRIRLQVLSDQPRIVQDNAYGMLTLDGLTTLLEAGRFIVYLQPKLSFGEGALVGAEALVRFCDSFDAVVEPGRFLPDLETAMLIKYVDFFVFESACHLVHRWKNSTAMNYVPISVNFSKMTLEEPNLVAMLLHLCRRYNIEPGCVEVEIAGTANKHDSAELSRIVDKIRGAGFLVSMDDFGIHFGNLSLLIALDCDKLKVDRSLVENVTTNPKAQSALRALAALSAVTGTRTTVEGIETEEQLTILKNMGFDEMQGYLISQPLTIEEFERKYLQIECERGGTDERQE